MLAILLSTAAVLLLPSAPRAQQAALTDDAYTSSAKPSKNFGADASVQVSGNANTGLLKFRLTPSLPPGTVGGYVGKATLKIFIDSVTTPGSLSVYRVAGAWAEESVTGVTAPALGSLETTVSINTNQAGKWLTVDLTQLVKDWLDNGLPNNGVAIVAGPDGSVFTFDSKENGVTSHEARLEVTLNHAVTADRAAEADHATNAASADTATNAATADTARGVASAAGDADIASPSAGQLYFNTTLKVFRQYDGTVWKTIDAGLASQLSSSGTLNAPTNPVDWTRLKNVPANVANGYTAGAGVSINPSNAISNTGVLSVSASGPLTTSGGQNPVVSLDGVVPVANGGTGLGSAGEAGRFLRSNGSAWTSAPLAAADIPAGSANYIRNSAAQQAGANFNVSGNGTLGGSLTANVVDAAAQYNIAGERILSITGAANTFVGVRAGSSNTSGVLNAFFGTEAGMSNTSGFANAFFGVSAGTSNTFGIHNSFFGRSTGVNNTTGHQNSFFGSEAGRSNASGRDNSFFGRSAGVSNSTGSGNTFLGLSAGISNTTGSNNTYVGTLADGAPGLTSATALGHNAQVTQSNSLVLGSIKGVNSATADTNVGIGVTAPAERLHVNGNVRISGAGNGLTFPDGTTQLTAALGGLNNVTSTGSNVSAEIAFSAPANYDTIPDMRATGVSPGPAGKAVVIGHVSISALSRCDVFRLRLAVDGTLVPQWQYMVRDCAEFESGVEDGPSIVSVSFMAVVALSPGQHTVELKVGSEDGTSRRFRVYTRDMSLLLF